MKPRTQNLLLAYAAVLSTVAVAAVVTQVTAAPKVQAFDEIDVKRINVREDDGTLRLVISNTSHFPGIIFRGKERPHPNRRTAGMLFFNEEGTENGGLIFGGKKVNGKVVGSGGHLSFDQYEQDQVIQFTQQEDDDKRFAALVISDRPEKSMDLDALERYTALPDGPEKEAALEELKKTFGGAKRVQVGKNEDRSSAVALHDAAGKPRMLLQVTAEGAASIQFLDENGKVTRTLTPSADSAKP